MNEIAKDFLTRCFAPDETIALLLRREKPARTQQHVVTLKQALAPRYLAWLARENDLGANIYVSANPLHPGSRKRTKESIASARHLYIDIDTDGDTRLAVLRASDFVPAPSAIMSTSPGKYQVLWKVDEFSFEQQERTLKLLAIAFGGDAACTDRNRVLRIPGFRNRKYDPGHLVTVEFSDNSIRTPSDFRLDVGVVDAMQFDQLGPWSKQTGKHSNSEHDWAWVSSQLAHGKDAGELTRELASRRADKPNPVYYAQRTVDVASARLWLIEGIRIDDVITMIESRRRFELPGVLCSARAREIAATAQRMITSQKTA